VVGDQRATRRAGCAHAVQVAVHAGRQALGGQARQALPVRMRQTWSTGTIYTLPSPILPVRAVSLLASI
jgi:hypothetical protein